jgi:hypothetical protein
MLAGGDNIIHGLLGSPFFRKYQAVLDFGTNTLTIREPLADYE